MALETIISTVFLDVYNHDKQQQTIKAISGDSLSRYVSAKLTRDETADYPIESTMSAELISLRPDNTVIISSAECRIAPPPTIITITPEAETTEIDGETVTIYHYTSPSGEEVYVDSGDDVTILVESDETDGVFAELKKEVIAVPGKVRCQFKITDSNRTIRTSYFVIDVGANLEDRGKCIIDLINS